MKHVFLVNPSAGKRDMTREISEAAARVMSRRDQPHVVLTTNRRNHAVELLKGMAAEGEPLRVYVAGGDGTLNEVATALIDAPHCAFAPYPVGTANDFIRTAGADKRNDFLDLEALVDGDVFPLDAITADGRVAINSLTCGFDSWVAYYAMRYKRMALISGMAYKLGLLNAFIRKTRNFFELVADGEPVPMRDYLFVVLMNGRFYGDGYQPTPMAELDDGRLELVMVDSVRRGAILRLSKPYRQGVLDQISDIIHIKRVREVEIRGREPFKLGLDGQMYDADRVTCRVAPGALRMILPRGWTGFPPPDVPVPDKPASRRRT